MNQADITSWHYFGPHSVRFEPADLIYSRPIGVITEGDAMRGWEFIRASIGSQRFFWLVDISKITRYSSAAAKLPPGIDPKKVGGFAAFGASFYQRTLLNAVLKALILIGYMDDQTPLAFFADEASARAWIDELRANTRER